jgi:hypothetical protein
MTHPEIARHPRPAQIEVTVAQAQIFVGRLRIDRKRKHVRSVENAQLVGNELDVAGRQLRVLRSRDAG